MSSICTLILAAGDQKRWNSKIHRYSKFKQLVNVDREPIIIRTQRLSVNPVVVTVHKAIKNVSIASFEPLKRSCIVETLYYSVVHWSARTIVLLGDVYYTDKAIETINSYSGEIGFFGNRTDILAISFTERYEVAQACQELLRRRNKEKCGKLWHLYRLLNGIPLDKQRITTNFIRIKDQSRDFDNPKQYLKFCLNRKK